MYYNNTVFIYIYSCMCNIYIELGIMTTTTGYYQQREQIKRAEVQRPSHKACLRIASGQIMVDNS